MNGQIEDSEGRIKAGTVSTPDLDASLADYARWLGYREVHRGTVDADLAVLWNAPKQEGRRYAVTAPESGAGVFIRFVEGGEMDAYEPLKSLGWAALELTVTDVEALDRKLADSPFDIIGPPAYLDFADAIYPMQVTGRAGEVLYLNQVNASLPDYDLPKAQSPVDHIFITILATPDLDRGVAFYTENFGWSQGNEYEVAYSVINNAFGFDPDREHKLSMTCVGRMVNNEIDQYPPEAAERPNAEGELPPGVAMVSFITRSLDAVKTAPVAGPVRRDEPPYDGRRVAVFRGSAGELVELIEQS